MSNKPNISKFKSWNDVEKHLKAFDEKEAGFHLEPIAKSYLRVKFPHEFKNIWMFSEIPHNVREHLILDNKDRGLDLVIETTDGQYIGVQVKYTGKDKKNLYWSSDRLTNCYAEGVLCDHLIIFTNALGIDNHSLKKFSDKLTLITRKDLEELTRDEIRSMFIPKKKVSTKKPKPRPYQRPHVNSTVKGLETFDRVQATLPCGYGKTHYSLFIKDRIKSKKTLVLVPSLQLVHQFLNDWRSFKKYIPYFCVCSDTTIDLDEKQDYLISELKAPGRVSTEPKRIEEFMKQDEFIIFSTYQSLPKIMEASNGTSFDLMIADEAHVTAVDKNSLFSRCLKDKNIKAKKRLFQTATPKVLHKEIESDAQYYVANMNDEKTYGPVVAYMSFATAIKKGILTDYEVLIVKVNNVEVRDWLRERVYVDDDYTIDEQAHVFAWEKARKEYGFTHTISFHSSRKRAKYRKDNSNGIPSYFVDGKQSANKRYLKIQDFVNNEVAIMTNARCLSLGLNIPCVDSVYFADPKNSKIDTTQGIGRALRLYKGKEKSYIIIPVFTHVDEDLKKNAYTPIMKMTRAIRDFDERIEEEITRLIYGKGKRRVLKINPKFKKDERVKLIGWEDETEKAIVIECLRRSLAPYCSYEQAKEYTRKLGLSGNNEWREWSKNGRPDFIPSAPERVYVDEWESWVEFLGTDNVKPTMMYETFGDFKPVWEYISKHGKEKASEKFGISTSVISTTMKRFGLSIKKKWSRNEIKEILDYVDECYDVQKALEKYEIARTTLSRYQKKYYPEWEVNKKEYTKEDIEVMVKLGYVEACKKYDLAGPSSYYHLINKRSL